MNLSRYFFLSIYYGLARYLPSRDSKIGGWIGWYMRNLCARHLFKYCSPTANIERMAYFGGGRDIEIGHRSGLGIGCHVPPNIKIGNNVMMGPHCFVLQNTTHIFDRIDIPIIDQGSRPIERRTVIGNDVWIGRQCIIMCGKQIGDHSIIAAGSVVCRDVAPWIIAGGNPIREIRKRK